MRVRDKHLDKVVESDVTLCDRSLVEQLELERKPRNVFLTTQKMKGSLKNGDSSLEVPKAWTVDHLNISESSIPKDGDVNSWPHLSGIEFPELKTEGSQVAHRM